MEHTSGGLIHAIGAVTSLVSHALVEADLSLLADRAVLDLVTATDKAVSVLEAARSEAIRATTLWEASENEAHCSTPEHLRRGLGHSIQHCRSLVKDAVRQGRFPRLVTATAMGEVRARQASAIARVLAELPDDLSVEQVALAEETMIGFAAEHGPDDLLHLGWHLLELVAPERVDELMAEKLEREEAEALKKRGLSLSDDRHDTMHIKGRLPVVDGEELAAVLNAHAESAWKRQTDELGPDAGPKDKGILLADALMTVIRAHQTFRDAPAHGGDRPRVKVLIRLEDLIAGLDEMALGSGNQITAGEARRMACDADIIPIVLNADGVPLNVGRQARLVPASMRVAVVARDRGCVFPGCDRGPVECEVHHIQPWWAGGPTSLANLVLLCPRHHRKCEPGRDNQWDDDDPDRWHVRLGPDRLPEITPPRGYDPDRRTIRHTRQEDHPPRRGILLPISRADDRKAGTRASTSRTPGPPSPRDAPQY